MDVVEKGLKEAVEMLRKNTSIYGFTASTENHSNYFSIWARDHSICAIAAALDGDKDLLDTAKRGILLLLRKQGDSGQVPSYIEVENQRANYGGLGTITSVDSNMWVVIAAAVLYKKRGDHRLVKRTNLRRYMKLYGLLKAFDSNDCGLIEVPKAGDWADIFNRTYHVLYDECLYYESLRSLQFLFESGLDGLDSITEGTFRKEIKRAIGSLRRRRARVKKRINEAFWFTEKNIPKVFEEYMIYDKVELKEYGYYQSHLMPFKIHWQNRIDTLGNVLAIVTGIADKRRAAMIITHIESEKINLPFPLRVLSPPVYRRDRGWESIYSRMELPHTYHNGGIWPMAAGFWIRALARQGKIKAARRELTNLASRLEKDSWGFNEYYHGKTLKPMGRTCQAWSAAGYLIAYYNQSKVFSY